MAMSESEPRRLDSWKEIARHLRRDVTTVIRWERERGLPVHRVPGGRLSRVFAFSDELDRWLSHAGQDQPPALATIAPPAADTAAVPDPLRTWRPRGPFVVIAVAALAAVAGAGGTLAWVRSPGSAVTLATSGNAIIGRSASGSEAWSYAFHSSEIVKTSERWAARADLDSNRHPDFLAAVGIRSSGSTAVTDRLHRFSDTGHLRWSYQLADRIGFRGGEYGPPWATSQVQTYRAGTSSRIAWAVHHFTWWPGLLISFDPDGTRTSTFVNGGWITSVQGTPDGLHLDITGVSNAHGAYVFAVLDAARPQGSSPEPPGVTECVSCPDGRPLHYFVLPRTDLSRQFAFPGTPPALTVFEDGSVQIQVMETEGPVIASTVYEFDNAFRIRSVRVSDGFLERHRQLEAASRLDHAADECRDRRARDIRHWTAASGWRVEAVTVGG